MRARCPSEGQLGQILGLCSASLFLSLSLFTLLTVSSRHARDGSERCCSDPCREGSARGQGRAGRKGGGGPLARQGASCGACWARGVLMRRIRDGQVQAVSIQPVDWKVRLLRSREPFALLTDCYSASQIQDYDFFVKKYPFILGTDVAGEVEEVGEGVKNVKKGNRVLAWVSAPPFARSEKMDTDATFAATASPSPLAIRNTRPSRSSRSLTPSSLPRSPRPSPSSKRRSSLSRSRLPLLVSISPPT